MTDEPQAIPAAGDVADATPAPDPVLGVTDEQLADLTEGDQAQTESDDEEVDWDGQKYRIPKPLKGALMMHKDYTQKTMSLAEQRKAVEEQSKAIAAREQEIQTDFEERATLHNLTRHIKAMQELNWNELAGQLADNGIESKATVMQRQLMLLQNQAAQLAQSVHSKAEQRKQQAVSGFAKAAEECKAILAKEIPGWSDDLGNKVWEFAKNVEIGGKKLSPEELATTNPVHARLLHLAYIGQTFLTKQQALTTKKKAESTPPAEPVQTVGTRSSPRDNSPRDSDSPETWLKKREAQLAARRKG